ncbi:hypothetical protein [uncultured Thiodictyon sp.]|uniref:hypothetical protein n=1 Tax=uncultured Thiodictyon sp. TaxID=1846217 RepID=UPI0025E1B527|nr:hypothetical protein [uncultured Thiodictyon sp.]
MNDGATVPLFYSKRVPEVQNQNDELSAEFYEILEEENLDPDQQAKLEQRFASELEVIKRDDRLETIAKDIVYHFPRRGYLGKGMVIAVDKFTAVKMYDKVQRLWKEEIKALRGQIKQTPDELLAARLKRMVETMRKEAMTKEEEKRVRLAAKALLQRLTEEAPRVLVQDWFKDSQTRLAVRDEVGKVLDRHLPDEGYDKDLFAQKRDQVFELTLDLAINHRKWAA